MLQVTVGIKRGNNSLGLQKQQQQQQKVPAVEYMAFFRVSFKMPFILPLNLFHATGNVTVTYKQSGYGQQVRLYS